MENIPSLINQRFVLAIVHDVTERKRVEKLYRQKDFYNTLLEAQSDLGEGLVIVEDERIVYANEAFLNVCGYTQEELAALPTCFDLLVEEEKVLFDGHLHRWHADEQLPVDNYETAILSKGGQRVDLECSAKVIEERGRIRLLVLARDITERKRAQIKLKHSLDALLALYEAGRVLVSSLNSEAVGPKLLKIMQRISGLSAAVIDLRD